MAFQELGGKHRGLLGMAAAMLVALCVGVWIAADRGDDPPPQSSDLNGATVETVEECRARLDDGLVPMTRAYQQAEHQRVVDTYVQVEAGGRQPVAHADLVELRARMDDLYLVSSTALAYAHSSPDDR